MRTLSLLASLMSATVMAKSETITVLATCAGGKGTKFEVTMSELVRHVSSEIGSTEVRVIGHAVLPKAVDLAGPSNWARTRRLELLQLPYSELRSYVERKQAEAKADPEKYRYSAPPKNVRDALTKFQMAFIGGCEILAPTRFEQIAP